jgi:hypothetical protein
MSSKDPRMEEIRLQNANDLMYGNKDMGKTFPFDVKSRFKYLIFAEKIRVAEDGVTTYSSASSKRYQFFTPEAYKKLIVGEDSSRKNYYERKGLKWTILHDPFLQAQKEGVTLKGAIAKKTGLTLAEKLAKAKSADEVGTKKVLTPKVEEPIFEQEELLTTFQEQEQVEQVEVKKAGRPRKEAN